jgi:hypothetical protein
MESRNTGILNTETVLKITEEQHSLNNTQTRTKMIKYEKLNLYEWSCFILRRKQDTN